MSRLVNETRFGQATALNPALKSDQTGAARQKSTRKKESSYQNLPSLQFTEFTVLFPFLFHDFLIYFELQYLEFPLVVSGFILLWSTCVPFGPTGDSHKPIDQPSLVNKWVTKESCDRWALKNGGPPNAQLEATYGPSQISPFKLPIVTNSYHMFPLK